MGAISAHRSVPVCEETEMLKILLSRPCALWVRAEISAGSSSSSFIFGRLRRVEVSLLLNLMEQVVVVVQPLCLCRNVSSITSTNTCSRLRQGSGADSRSPKPIPNYHKAKKALGPFEVLPHNTNKGNRFHLLPRIDKVDQIQI